MRFCFPDCITVIRGTPRLDGGSPSMAVGATRHVVHPARLIVGTPRLVVGAPGLVVSATRVVVGAPGFVVRAPGLVVGTPRLVISPHRLVVGTPRLVSGPPRLVLGAHRWSQVCLKLSPALRCVPKLITITPMVLLYKSSEFPVTLQASRNALLGSDTLLNLTHLSLHSTRSQTLLQVPSD